MVGEHVVKLRGGGIVPVVGRDERGGTDFAHRTIQFE
jgi:hypothetical protein